VRVAIALYPGVSADECEAFTLVFDRLEGIELVGVGSRVGIVEGPGGAQRIDAVYADVRAPDVVLVPGGIGCARAAVDEELLAWLRSSAERCRWMAASSTGTVIVAATGLLDNHAAATHWLASDLLASYGSATSSERIVEIGRIITCEGRITAMHVALLVTLRLAGPDAVRSIREQLEEVGERRGSSGSGPWFRRRRRRDAPKPLNRELNAPDVIEFDPITVHPR